VHSETGCKTSHETHESTSAKLIRILCLDLFCDRNDDAVSESLDEAGSVDGDSVTSESSSETGKSQDEADKMAGSPPLLDLSKPWVDISILEFEDPSLFMVRMQSQR